MTGTTSDVRRRPSGLLTGSMIALSFGTVFVMVNSGGLAGPWPLVIRVAGVLVAVALFAGVLRVARLATVGARPGDVVGFTDRRYWYAVAGEVVALFGGLYVINQVLAAPEVAVAWVAVVVGVHFFPLAWAWRMPVYHWLGAAMTLLGVAGFVAHGLGASDGVVGLIAGVGSGAALYAAVAAGIQDARGRARAAGRLVGD
ncbi:hypothetical protein [Actinoplanes sp. L3-i22]|uniref:hypothetical protein n=1 Tax=Actinoplanes sp. L3-i22 TaxID=2836373 RepID=UPI001C74C94A|nr:hypothetical protein [Actinoplanes sp. L3-i22]BCY08150.1 hypothetical protein L3i22_032380 [Actinoplanes sp. L3-i22]